jgi:hypothetical protein
MFILQFYTSDEDSHNATKVTEHCDAEAYSRCPAPSR